MSNSNNNNNNQEDPSSVLEFILDELGGNSNDGFDNIARNDDSARMMEQMDSMAMGFNKRDSMDLAWSRGVRKIHQQQDQSNANHSSAASDADTVNITEDELMGEDGDGVLEALQDLDLEDRMNIDVEDVDVIELDASKRSILDIILMRQDQDDEEDEDDDNGALCIDDGDADFLLNGRRDSIAIAHRRGQSFKKAKQDSEETKKGEDDVGSNKTKVPPMRRVVLAVQNWFRSNNNKIVPMNEATD